MKAQGLEPWTYGLKVGVSSGTPPPTDVDCESTYGKTPDQSLYDTGEPLQQKAQQTPGDLLKLIADALPSLPDDVLREIVSLIIDSGYRP